MSLKKIFWYKKNLVSMVLGHYKKELSLISDTL